MMLRLFFLALVALAAALVPADAQTVSAERFRLLTGPCVERSGSGTPEGVQAGNPCDTWHDTATGLVYKKITGTGTTTGWLRLLGPTAATCTTFAGCVAAQATLDTTLLKQVLRTDATTGLQQSVTESGAWLESYTSGGWAPFYLSGGPVRIAGGGFQVGTDTLTDPGLGNAAIDGYIGSSAYTTRAAGWRVDDTGAADFRYLYADEMHVKSFIADLEQALAGGQIISKSVAVLASDFTVPAGGSIATLTVKDLPSASNMAVFESGDYVRIREFSRAAGSLSVTDAWGIVTGYADGDDGVQTWTFTRLVTNGGAMTTGTVIPADAIVLDYGVSGNGFYEVSATDGVYAVDAPYAQIVTWAGNSPLPANQTIRARFGNLRGITGTSGEYGFIAGTYAATGGRYVRASNQAFELHGIDLSLWNGTTRVMRMDPINLYESIGNPAPTAYGVGVGCWSGMDAGVFKWRCGDPAGHLISFNSLTGTLNVNGNVTVTGLIADDTNAVNGVPSTEVASGAQRANLGLTSGGNPSLPAAAAASGSGLFLGSDKVGFFTGGVWKTYMDNVGNFYLGGSGGVLQYTGSTNTLTIAATLSGNGSGITAISGGNITTDSITATQIAASAITASELAADSVTSAKILAGTITADDIAATTITGAKIAAGTITGTNIAAATISATEIAAATITADKLNVASLSAISANLGTITAGSISGVTATFGGGAGDVTLNSSGVSFTAGLGDPSKVKWDNGAYIGANASGGAAHLYFYAPGPINFRPGTDMNFNMPVGGDFYIIGADEIRLQANQFYFFDLPNYGTAADVNPVIMVGSTMRQKTNGAHGTFCGFSSVNSIEIERGIVVGVTCSLPQPDAEVAALRREVADLRALIAALPATVLVSQKGSLR